MPENHHGESTTAGLRSLCEIGLVTSGGGEFQEEIPKPMFSAWSSRHVHHRDDLQGPEKCRCIGIEGTEEKARHAQQPGWDRANLGRTSQRLEGEFSDLSRRKDIGATDPHRLIVGLGVANAPDDLFGHISTMDRIDASCPIPNHIKYTPAGHLE